MDSGSEKRTEEVEKAFLQSDETESGSYSTFEKVSFGGGERTGNSEKDESAAASISFLYYIQRFCQVKMDFHTFRRYPCNRKQEGEKTAPMEIETDAPGLDKNSGG